MSPDYVAMGDAAGVRVFVYGGRTVLEEPSNSLWLGVYDETGTSVPCERVGKYCRVTRVLPSLTVRINWRSIAFELLKKVRTSDIAAAGADPAAESLGGHLAPLPPAAARLVRLTPAATITRRGFTLTFNRIGATVNATAGLQAEVVSSAAPAARVDLHGFTDSRVAGPPDQAVADQRVRAVCAWLVEGGAPVDRIRIVSTAAGGFAVPNKTLAGRAMNRRVEIGISEESMKDDRT